MKEFMEINGKTFEVMKKKVDLTAFNNRTIRTLYDCYSRPSATKERIYDDWGAWYSNTLGVHDLSVRSYNCNFFTLEATYHTNGKIYYVEITPTHNRLYETL